MIVEGEAHCDYCLDVNPTTKRRAKVNGKTKDGGERDMCAIHFGMHGVGFGPGIGQRLEVKS